MWYVVYKHCRALLALLWQDCYHQFFTSKTPKMYLYRYIISKSMDQMKMCFDMKLNLNIVFSIQWLLSQTAINTEGFCFKNSVFSKMLGKVLFTLLAVAYTANATVSTYFTVRNLHFYFVQKFNFDFPRKLSIFSSKNLLK